jgi:hypothetical protein
VGFWTVVTIGPWGAGVGLLGRSWRVGREVRRGLGQDGLGVAVPGSVRGKGAAPAGGRQPRAGERVERAAPQRPPVAPDCGQEPQAGGVGAPVAVLGRPHRLHQLRQPLRRQLAEDLALARGGRSPWRRERRASLGGLVGELYWPWMNA